MHKAPRVFPIIGGRKVEHLYQNIEALSISLTAEQVKALDGIVPFNKGFPYNVFVSEYILLVCTACLTVRIYIRVMARNTTLSTLLQGTSISGRSLSPSLPQGPPRRTSSVKI